MFKKRSSALLFIFLLLFSLAAASLFYVKTEPKREFCAIIDTLLTDSLKENSLLCHFLLSDDSALTAEGISMPVYSKENTEKSFSALKDTCAKLHSLDLSGFNPGLSNQRDSLCFYLEHNLALGKYSYFEEPFAPYSGVQNELPILLTEYAFYEKKDVENYLQILKQIPAYLEGLCQYEKEKADAGLFMDDLCADKVISSLQHFCSLPETDNPFLTTFETRLQTLLSNGTIQQAEYDALSKKNKEAVFHYLLPSYQKTAEFLISLKNPNHLRGGLSAHNLGKDYYETLISAILGEDVDVTALKNTFSRQLVADFTDLKALLEKNPEYFAKILCSLESPDPLTALTPEECMEILQKEIAKDFSFSGKTEYPYTLKSVAASMEAYTNPAYYFTPPTDDSTRNVIYVNNSQTPIGISLFTTLAHEGFPGHLYQSVTSANALKDAGLPSLSGTVAFPGYTEGFATYVEFLSYEYAKNTATQLTGSEDADLYYDYLLYNRRICLCLYAIMDIMIHHENAGTKELRPYMARIGITKDCDIEAVYDYILSEPGTYVTYYGGYLKILECRHLAMEHWGENFTNKAFHRLLLEQGPQSFPCIREQIKVYLK